MKPYNFRWMRTKWAMVLALVALASLPGKSSADKESQLLTTADAIAKKVASLRGLKLKKSIQRGVMDKRQIKKRLLKRIDQEYTPAEIAAEEIAMKRLGLLPADADYLDIVVKLLTDQIAGFYDPWEQQLYIASWGGLGGDMLLAHEIDHALQDQHFDLRKFMKEERDNADAMVARQALVEGDGTAVMIEFTMDDKGLAAPWGQSEFLETIAQTTASMGGMVDAPLALKKGLLFPYMRGLVFVGHYLRHNSWRRIDKMYKKPPLSTEHILHPDKFDAYEKPVEVKSAALPTLKGYKLAYDNVSGELGMSILFEQHGAGEDKAAEAAAGWGGDRLVIYTPPGHKGKVGGTVGVSYSVWDETADAIEFFEALSDAMPSLAGGKSIVLEADRVEYKTRSGAIAIAERKRDAVVLVVGAPPARADDVVEQTWLLWKRE